MIGETLSPARAEALSVRRSDRAAGVPRPRFAHSRCGQRCGPQKIEGLGQHVVVGNGLKLWNVHPLEKSP